MARAPGHRHQRWIVSSRQGKMHPSVYGNRLAHASPHMSEDDKVFEAAGELFALLSTPVRLKILSALCHGERNVSYLVEATHTKQPNLSQHLTALYRAGILGRRREGTQIFYSIQSQQAVQLCRAVCTQIALDLDLEPPVSEAPQRKPATKGASKAPAKPTPPGRPARKLTTARV